MLPTINCPKCGKQMVFEPSKEVKSTSKFEDCIRYCPNCNCGASNSKSKVTYLYKNFIDNLPVEYHSDLEKLNNIFDNALNERNREEKKIKFSFSTSEDAYTWIFFSYFFKNEKLSVVLPKLNLDYFKKAYKVV